MIRLFVQLHCLLLVMIIVRPALHAQSLTLSAGAATCNNSTVPTATFSLLYETSPTSSGWVYGIRAGQLYGVPTEIYASNSSGTEFIRNDGTSTVTFLLGTAGYTLALDRFAITALGSFGGVNSANRRYIQYSGLFIPGVTPSWDDPNSTTWTTFAASIAYGASLTLAYTFSDHFSATLTGGWDHFSADLVTSPNVEPYRTYTANLAGPQSYLTLGLRYTLPNGLRDTLPNGLRSTLRVLAILGSTHPFTSTPYNEFNPGLAVHWRPNSAGTTLFAEAGAYQYSVGDRAMYLGGGVLFPLGTEWLKAGIFGGLLTTYDAQDVYFYPALSPRLSFETPWVTATALLIPAGDATAIGFMMGFPLF